MKKEVPIQKSTSLINLGCVVLATVKFKEQSNIITLAWQTPLSIKPKLLGISVGFKRHSHDMIMNAGEFAVNIPGKNLLKETHGCGRVSGKDTDKFDHFNLTPEKGKHIASPGIKECLGIIECQLENHFTTGDHTFFVGRVLGAKAEKSAYNFDKNCWKTEPESELLYHLGGDHYLTGSTYLQP
jgi:flavin reductase (DIM6/NTAB) family NADH-FMN oxidoreductase RutF